MKKVNNTLARLLAVLAIAILVGACADHRAPAIDDPAGPAAPLTVLAAAPAAGTLAQTYSRGELNITITHGGASHTYTYTYASAGGGWNIPDPADAPRLAAGAYPATAEGWLMIPFDDSENPEDTQQIPVTWAGNLMVGIDPAANCARMQGTIALVPAAARMAVNLTGAWGEGDLAATETFAVNLHEVMTYQVDHPSNFGWAYPRHPYSLARILPQTLTGPREFISLSSLTSGSKYKDKTYKIDLPVGTSFTFEAGHQYTLNITLDAKAGTATLTNLTITPFADGGTPALDDPRPGIRTAQDLIDFSNEWNLTGLDDQKIAEVMAKWAGDDGVIRLLADIDMSGAGNFTPIGKSGAEAFTGKFDGGGHTITGLTVNSSREAGLFGLINGAHIRRVRLAGASIKGILFAGGIVGYSNGSTLAGCTVQGDIEVYGRIVDACSGGIAGTAYQSQVIACAFTGELTASGRNPTNAGGIAAVAQESNIAGCYTHITAATAINKSGIARFRRKNTYAGNVFLLTGGITEGIAGENSSPEENTGATELTPELVERMNAAIAGGSVENGLRWHGVGDGWVGVY